MTKLFTIVQKNLRIFMRSRVSAFIIFLGPLLLVSLIGLSFSGVQLPGLSVAVFSPTYNEFTNSILEKIEENKFPITKFESQEACANDVKRNRHAICLVFPENMDKNNNEVTFIVDYSKINLVWIVVDIFTGRVAERATELRTSLATDLLNKVIQTREDSVKQKTVIESVSAKQNEAKSILSSAQNTLGQIDPRTDFGVDASDSRSSINTIVSKVKSAKGDISDAKDDVDGSSLSDTEKNAINEDLDSATSSLSNALVFLEGNASTKSLEFLVSSLDNALQDAKGQLELIKKRKESASGDLITLESSLTSSVNALSDITTAVAQIISRIEGVQSGDVAQLVSPIRTRIEPVTLPETHFNYLFPTLIVMVVMLTTVLLSSTLVMNEKKSRALFRNFITPTSGVIFDLGIFVTSLIAIIIQLVIFLFISSIFFGTGISGVLWQSTLVLLVVASTFILLGMVIGYVFKSEETYVLAAITVSALLLFLSSTIMPIESISDILRRFALATPFVVSENILRQLIFFQFPLRTLISELLILGGYIVAFSAIIAAVQKLARYHVTVRKRQEVKR